MDNDSTSVTEEDLLRLIFVVSAALFLTAEWQRIREIVSRGVLPDLEAVLINLPDGVEVFEALRKYAYIANLLYLPLLKDVLGELGRQDIVRVIEPLQKGDRRPLNKLEEQVEKDKAKKSLSDRNLQTQNLGIENNHGVSRPKARQDGNHLRSLEACNSHLESTSRNADVLQRQPRHLPQRFQQTLSNTAGYQNGTNDQVRNFSNREYGGIRTASKEEDTISVAYGSATFTIAANQNSAEPEGATADNVDNAEMPNEHSKNHGCSRNCGGVENLSPNMFQNMLNIICESLNAAQRWDLQKNIEYYYQVDLDCLETMLMKVTNCHHIANKCLVHFLRETLSLIGRVDLVHALDGMLAGDNSLLAALKRGQKNGWYDGRGGNGGQWNVNPPHAPRAVPTRYNYDSAGMDSLCERNRQRSGTGSSEQDDQSFQRSAHQCCICSQYVVDAFTNYLILPCSHKAHEKCLVRRGGRLTRCPICSD